MTPNYPITAAPAIKIPAAIAAVISVSRLTLNVSPMLPAKSNAHPVANAGRSVSFTSG
jgi:hypothetical protein